MSYRVGCPEWVLGLPVDGNAVRLLVKLWTYADGEKARAACAGEGPDPFVWPSRERLEADLPVTARAIRRQVVILEAAGVMRRERREVGGRLLDGFVLAAVEPGVSDRTSAAGRERPDVSVRRTGRQRPADRTSASAVPDVSVRTMRTLQEHSTDHTEDHTTPDEPAPLRLVPVDLVETRDPVDDVLALYAELRRGLGHPGTPRRPSAARRRSIAKRPADVATTLRRMAEDARRQAEEERRKPVDVWPGKNLTLAYASSPRAIDRYADRTDLDERRPQRARGSPAKRRVRAPFNPEDMER